MPQGYAPLLAVRHQGVGSSSNHPHILTVHDADEYEGRQYLVTEFVDGGTLKDWSRAEKVETAGHGVIQSSRRCTGMNRTAQSAEAGGTRRD